MKLANVLAGCEYELAEGRRDILEREISGIAYDSRKVSGDSMFVAVKGDHLDGHQFIGDAVRRGAAVVVGEEPASPSYAPVFVRVRNSRKTLACAANNFYGRPSEDLAVIGITGTNGKTTTSYLIKSILEAWKKKTGLIGTITYLIGDKSYPSLHTTPESPEFQALLREMKSAGCSHVVTEVSSHSLSQQRVDHTRFLVVVFTNLTRDHLDFHKTMEDYFAAKKRLFTELLTGGGSAVINLDDERGRALVSAIDRGGNGPRAIITYGTNANADISAARRTDSLTGVSFALTWQGGTCRIESPLIGLPNVYNILAAISVGVALQVPMEVIREGIRNVGQVRGRLEQVDAGQDFLCVVDYAHTPDALERLILTARDLLRNKEGPGRVITLFGCGGDRDRGKRSAMGEIAARLSDVVIITSDNPRSEDPGEIIREIVSGIAGVSYNAVPDRGEAIRLAVGIAEAGDILIIAGKGHEEYQEINGVRYLFNDKEAAAEAIRRKLTEVLKR